MKKTITFLLVVLLVVASFGALTSAQSEDTVNILFWQAASHMNPLPR